MKAFLKIQAWQSHMAGKWEREPEFFDCPHCGAPVPVSATVCRECGSDAETGWSEDAEVGGVDTQTGYSSDDDFDYNDFVRREFPGQSGADARQAIRTWVTVLVVVLTCIGLLRWASF